MATGLSASELIEHCVLCRHHDRAWAGWDLEQIVRLPLNKPARLRQVPGRVEGILLFRFLSRRACTIV